MGQERQGPTVRGHCRCWCPSLLSREGMQYRDKRNAGIWWSLSAPLLALEGLVLPANSLSNSSAVVHALDESSWRVWACVPRPGPTELLQLSGPERRPTRRRSDFGQSHNQVGILTADLWRHVKPPLRNPSDRSSDSLPEESAGPHFHCVSARQGLGEPRLGDMHGGRVGNRSKHSLPRAHLPCRGGRQILQPQRA